MITKIDPSDFGGASTIQLDSDASDTWAAQDEIENWAAAHGFVRTSEYHLRQVLIGGKRRFRAICYRISEEEMAAIEDSQSAMVRRGDLIAQRLGTGTGQTK